MTNETQFIEIRKIITDKKTNQNTHSELHTINVNEIKSFRKWHKRENDANIVGEMTIIVLDKQEIKIVRDDSEKFRMRTALIEESYESFMCRLNEKVPVKKL